MSRSIRLTIYNRLITSSFLFSSLFPCFSIYVSWEFHNIETRVFVISPLSRVQRLIVLSRCRILDLISFNINVNFTELEWLIFDTDFIWLCQREIIFNFIMADMLISFSVRVFIISWYNVNRIHGIRSVDSISWFLHKNTHKWTYINLNSCISVIIISYDYSNMNHFVRKTKLL